MEKGFSDRATAGGHSPQRRLYPTGEFVRAVTEAEPQLRRYARRLAQRPSDVDDILQETWLLAWSRRADYLGTGSTAGWLLRICRTACRRVRTTNRVDSLNPETSRPESISNEEAIARDSRDDERLSLVLSLPARRRQVVLGRYFMNLSINELAAQQFCAPGTIKATLHQATAWLRARDHSTSPRTERSD